MTRRVGFIDFRGHAGSILQSPTDTGRLAAVACADEPRREAFARSFPAVGPETNFYADYRDMLAKEDLEIVGILGHDGERLEQITECASAKVNLIAEKPLVRTLEELPRAREAIEKSGVLMSMLLTMRMDSRFLCLREAVARGDVGVPIQVSSQKSYRLGQRDPWQQSRETFSGIIPFVGIHSLALMRWAGGIELTEVAAFHANVRHPELGDFEDTACVLVRLANGGTGTTRLDYLRPAAAPTHGDDRVRIAGDQGVIEVGGPEADVTLITAEEGPRALPRPAGISLFDSFCRALDGEGDPLVPPEDAYRMTEIALKARLAADERRIVSL